MKTRLIVYALFFLITYGSAQAATTDAFLDADTGKIIMPHFIFNDEIYYLTLSPTDVETLTFQVDVESVTNFTPPAAVGTTVNTDSTSIVGFWILPGSSTAEFFILFRSNGTYTYFLAADDGNCVAGEETGTYKWEPSTGLLLTTQTSDHNGSCGLSHPNDDIPFRVFVDGNSLQLLEQGGGEPLEEFGFERAP